MRDLLHYAGSEKKAFATIGICSSTVDIVIMTMHSQFIYFYSEYSIKLIVIKCRAISELIKT